MNLVVCKVNLFSQTVEILSSRFIPVLSLQFTINSPVLSLSFSMCWHDTAIGKMDQLSQVASQGTLLVTGTTKYLDLGLILPFTGSVLVCGPEQLLL